MSGNATQVNVPVGTAAQPPVSRVHIPTTTSNNPSTVTRVAIPAITQSQQPAVNRVDVPANGAGVARNAEGEIELRQYCTPNFYLPYSLSNRVQQVLENAYAEAEQLYPNMTTFNPITGQVTLDDGSKVDLASRNDAEAAAALSAFRAARREVANRLGISVGSLPQYQPGETGPINARAITTAPQNQRCSQLNAKYADVDASFDAIHEIIAQAVLGAEKPGANFKRDFLATANDMIKIEQKQAILGEGRYQNGNLARRITRESGSPVSLAWGLQVLCENRNYTIAQTTDVALKLRERLEGDLLSQRRDKATNIFKKVLHKAKDKWNRGVVQGEGLSAEEKKWIEGIVTQAIPKHRRKEVLRKLKIEETQDTFLEHLILPTLLARGDINWEEGAQQQREDAFNAMPQRLQNAYPLPAQPPALNQQQAADDDIVDDDEIIEAQP